MEFSKALKTLIIDDPFYGLFLLNLNKFPNNKIDTLCVSYDNTSVSLQYNESFWESLTDTEQLAVLKHEILHLIFKHLLYFKEFPNHTIANIAHDMEVNQYIEGLPKGCIDYSEFSTQYAEIAKLGPKAGSLAYYKVLIDLFPNFNSNSSGGSQSSGSGSNGENPFDGITEIDDHSKWNTDDLSDAKKTLLSDQIKTYVENTVNSLNKARGTIPGNISSFISEILKVEPPVFNWKAYFRRLAGSSYQVFAKKSLRKESKRFAGSAGIKLRKKQHILVGIDTSGSVNDEELADFINEIDYIHKTVEVTVLQCDTEINKIVEYRNKKQLYEISGRGGTDFNPVVDYYFNNRNKYTSLIYFTDGYAPVNDLKYTKNLIWVITSDGCDQDYPGFKIQIPKKRK